MLLFDRLSLLSLEQLECANATEIEWRWIGVNVNRCGRVYKLAIVHIDKSCSRYIHHLDHFEYNLDSFKFANIITIIIIMAKLITTVGITGNQVRSGQSQAPLYHTLSANVTTGRVGR